MRRLVILATCLLAAVTFFTRSPRGQRALSVIVGLMILYVVLKLSGVIDAIEPQRGGF